MVGMFTGVMIPLLLLGSIITYWHFTKEEPDKKKATYSKYGIIVGSIGTLLILIVGFSNSSEVVETKEEQQVVVEESEVTSEKAKEETENEEKEALTFEVSNTEEEEQEYRDFVIETSSGYSKFFDEFAEQLLNTEATDEWMFKTALIVEGIKNISDNIIEYDDNNNIPVIYMDVHAPYKESAFKYKRAMELFVEGFDSGDSDLIEESIEEMNAGKELVNEASSILLGE